MRRETLILFARPPLPGRAKTRLLPALGPEGAAGLYRAFLRDAAALAASVRERRTTVGLQAEWALEEGERLEDFPLGEWLPGPFHHRQQEGAHLGARMAAALGRRLAGGGRAVLLGTDFPDLPPEIPLSAFAALENAEPASARAVLGPAVDGGYYLIGLNRSASSVFEEIPWGTSQVLSLTELKFQSLAIPYVLTERWADVDDPEGLSALRARLASFSSRAAAHTRRFLDGLHG